MGCPGTSDKVPNYAAQNPKTGYILDLETFSIFFSSIEINLF